MPRASIDHTEDGMVVWNFPMHGAASGGNMVMTAEEAREMGVALIARACMADGNPMSAEEIRVLKRAVFR